MSTTLYRKYRPQKFSEIIGQQHIVQTLSNAIKHNRIGQAYLFTGPRGTGKTTLARIFAKAVNCANLTGADPCRQCDICKNIEEGKSLDVIEIDAASNTGVDNIRELRETVKLPPTQAKYKVYIIDEVHMLSAGAFNALLKTLEEPPAHVIFILATTEIHKVPETILSRCQRFDFSRLSLEQIIKKLSEIAKQENVSVEKNALEMIAIAAEGGMRDAESLLAQIIALEDESITAKEVEEILGASRRQSIEKMAELILNEDAGGALSLINKLSGEGTNMEVFNKSLLNYLRQLMLASIDAELVNIFSLELTGEQIENLKKQAQNHATSRILNVINCLVEAQQKIRLSFIPQLPLEIAIVKATQKPLVNNSQPADNKEIKNNNLKISNFPASPAGRQFPISNKITNAKSQNTKKTQENIPNTKCEAQNTNLSIDQIQNNWNEITRATQPHNHSLMAFLSNCQPVKIEEGKIIIATKYNLYKDKLNEKKNRAIIEEVIAKLLNSPATVKFVTEEEAGVKITKQLTTDNKQRDDNLLTDAMKIMGGKIVEE